MTPIYCTGALARGRRVRLVLAGIFLSLAAGAQNVDNLPDMGSPSDTLLSKKIEAQIGRQVYYSLLDTGTVISDPELQEYIQTVGMKLVAHARADGQRFTFFMVNNDTINAFALPGGYIGVHTGLLLRTTTESELAGVLAHEISHVTQRHISRAVFDNQQASTLTMAALLGAILIGVATGADPGLISGAVSATQSAAIENQISFTRSNEYEADRVGMTLLASSDFDPAGMVDFFETMGRETNFLEANDTFDFMRTHPVSGDRVAEARGRARQYPPREVSDSVGYQVARARARLLTASRPEAALEQFRQMKPAQDDEENIEIRYGTAIANAQLGNFIVADEMITELLDEHDEIITFHSDKAIMLYNLGQTDAAMEVFENAMLLFPRNVPLTVRYSEALLRDGQAKKAHRVLLDLLNQVPPTLEQVRLIAIAANSAGDVADAHYYMAEYHAMNGSLRMAITQLNLALATPGLDSVQRARFEARLRQFQQYLPENEQRENSGG